MASLSLTRTLCIAGLCLMLSACGLTAPRSSEGYADLESLGMLDTDTVMTLSIGPSLLRFAASHVDNDPEVSELLKSLDGIRIRIYEINGDASRVANRINTMSGNLQQDGWEPVLQAASELAVSLGRQVGWEQQKEAVELWADVCRLDGSTPTASHASAYATRRSPARSGAPQVFHSCAWRAVILSMRGLPVPTRIGSVFWIGCGSHGASVMS